MIEALEARIAPATLTLMGPGQISEGHGGVSAASFLISLDEPAPEGGVTVQFSTQDGSATVADGDYLPLNVTVVFAAGETSHAVAVGIRGDQRLEANETFSAHLSGATGAAIGAGNAVLTLLNEDLVSNPQANIVAAVGQGGVRIDLGHQFDGTPAAGGGAHSFVEFTTNFLNPSAPGVPQKLVLELFDDRAPLTVANFLSYVLNKSAAGDYDGVFFHRLVPGFVLQGGGFSASSPGVHIPTGPLLHNEFDTAWAGYGDSMEDGLRANVRGTIAMAKLGTAPNTASSEFFFNLADNSSNLDGQNGGFTVFGKLTEASLQVLDDISALGGRDLGAILNNSALSAVPVQNYLSGKPAASQLIQITDAKVLAPEDGASPGHAFSLAGIVDAGTGLSSTVISAKLTGDTLDLKFKPGASGVVKVSLLSTPTDGGAPIASDFLVTIASNLLASAAGTTLPGIIVPGDSGLAKVKIINSGAAAAKGMVDVKFYLSHVGGFNAQGAPNTSDPYGLRLGADDVQIGALFGKAINVAAGKSVVLSTKVQIPQELFRLQGEEYRIIAVVETPHGSTISELFGDDNSSLDGSVHRQFNAFGSFNTSDAVRKNAALTYHDASGNPVTFKMSGTGYGQLSVDADGSVDLSVNGTNAASRLSSTTAPGAAHFELRDVIVSQAVSAAPIGTVSMAGADILGRVIAFGGLKSLTLGDFKTGDGTGHYIGIGQTAELANARPVLKFGSLTDTDLESLLPLGSLTAVKWLNSNAQKELIVAPGLGSLVIAGDLAADLTVVGAQTITIFKVGGSLTGAAVHVLGSVANVQLGAMHGSTFTVGDNGRGQLSATSVIGSFAIQGAPGAADLMSGSVVTAPQIGRVYVQSVDPDSGPTGFVAHAIGSYQRALFKIANIVAGAQPANNFYDVEGSYAVQLV